MIDKRLLIAGGVGVVALAAFFLLKGGNEDLIPTGGSSYGSSGGYEGGGAGGTSYFFGDEIVNFPAPETFSLSNLLPDSPQNESNDLRYARGGDVINGTTLKKPFVVAATGKGNEVSVGGSTPKDEGFTTIIGGLLDAVFKPVTTTIGATKAIASAGSGMFGGSGNVGVAKKPFVVANTGTGFYTSAGGGRTYNQANPGAPGSGYVVRGYSLTGKPLYKPVSP